MATAKKGGLGRGLGAILIDNNETSEEKSGVVTVRIAEVEPNADQPRKQFDFEALQNLAASISNFGVIQPITVRRVGDMYQIIAGERRWRAARMAGLSEIPVIITEADDRLASEMALVENIQRSDLNAIEEAEKYFDLMDEYDLTQDEIAERVGKSRSAVANILRLLDLPKSVQEMVVSRTLTAGHAKALLGLSDHAKIEDTAKTVVKKELSVRDTEKLVKKINSEVVVIESVKPAVDYTRELEKKIETQIGRRVKIVEKGENSSITIGYTDHEDLEKVLRALCGSEFVDSLD